MRLRTCALALTTLSLSACTSNSATTPSASSTPSSAAPRTAITETPRPVVAPSKEQASAFAAASNAFGGELYARVSTQPGNFTMSPASISMALAMTWTGARGETREQMTKVLHLSGDPKELTESAAKLLSTYNDPERTDYTLSVVNRLFGEKTYPFDPGFLALTKNEFGAELAKVDFKTQFEPARADINAFVAKSTHDKIKDLLPQGSLDELTRLVLVNAIYLHADWAIPFEKEATSPAPFHVTGDKTTEAPTMHNDARLGFAEVDGVRVLEMPYKGGDMSMMFLLPNDPAQLGALEQRLEKSGVDDLHAKAEKKLVRVALPKFKVEPGDPIALRPELQAMGMPLAFVDGGADFSGMIDPSAPETERKKLHIDNVYHKAFVAVDEAGTEAAAATAVVMATEGAAMPQKPDAEFIADHPFLFVIRDDRSGMMMFVGRVVNPAA